MQIDIANEANLPAVGLLQFENVRARRFKIGDTFGIILKDIVEQTRVVAIRMVNKRLLDCLKIFLQNGNMYVLFRLHHGSLLECYVFGGPYKVCDHIKMYLLRHFLSG